MGYNTTVVILNDALSYIAEDAEFGKRLADAIKRKGGGDSSSIQVSAHGKNCIHGNAATVIETHHAGHDVLVSVGGNTGRVVKPSQQAPRVEPLKWESTTPGYIKYVTDAKYQQFSPEVQRWYRPICQTCAASPQEFGKMRDLLDEDGENRAVRSFLMQYSCDRSITVETMRKHMERCGWNGCWPEWVGRYDESMHLTKGGAQAWLRHLFSLESAKTSHDASAQEGAPS